MFRHGNARIEENSEHRASALWSGCIGCAEGSQKGAKPFFRTTGKSVGTDPIAPSMDDRVMSAQSRRAKTRITLEIVTPRVLRGAYPLQSKLKITAETLSQSSSVHFAAVGGISRSSAAGSCSQLGQIGLTAPF
jgi:hypothetical protein